MALIKSKCSSEIHDPSDNEGALLFFTKSDNRLKLVELVDKGLLREDTFRKKGLTKSIGFCQACLKHADEVESSVEKRSTCASILHSPNDDEVCFLTKVEHQSKLQQLVLKGFLDKEDVRKKRNDVKMAICTTCMTLADQRPLPDDKKVNQALCELNGILKTLPEDFQINDDENVEMLGNILFKLSRTQRQSLAAECQKVRETPNSNQIIKEKGDCVSFIKDKDRNVVVIKTLLGFSSHNGDFSNVELARLKHMCLSYENILGSQQLKTITPPSLANNFKLQIATNSKRAVNENGYPTGGSYWTVRKVIDEPLPKCSAPKGDFAAPVDNIQKKTVTAKSTIEEGSAFKMKVCSDLIYLQTEKDKVSNVLKNPENKPSNFLNFNPSPEEVDTYEAISEMRGELANKVRHTICDDWLQQVVKEKKEKSDPVKKFRTLRNSNKNKKMIVCPTCFEMYEFSTQKPLCIFCKNNPQHGDFGENPYSFVEGKKNPCTVTVGEVGDFLPAGEDGCEMLLKHIRHECITRPLQEQGEKNHVAVSVGDGRIYHDAGLVQHARRFCSSCDVPYDQDSDAETHIGHSVDMVYGDIFLVLGLGHFRFLVGLSIMQNSWIPAMKDFAILLGHRTGNAQEHVRLCKNKHKTDQIISAFTKAGLQELFSVYVDQTGEPYTVNNFIDWCSARIRSPQAFWLFQITFSISIFYIIMRAAERMNNIEVFFGAFYKMRGLIFSSNHPIYRGALLRTGITDVQCPPRFLQFVNDHRIVQRKLPNGEDQPVDHTHQAADLQNEEFILLQLRAMESKVLADFKQFSNAARRLHFHGENAFTKTGYNRLRRRPFLFGKEVMTARSLLRPATDSLSDKDKPFCSLDGKTTMSANFHNFKFDGEKQFQKNCDELRNGCNFFKVSKTYLPRTEEDEEKIRCKNTATKKDLHRSTLSKINQALGCRKNDKYLIDMKQLFEQKTASKWDLKANLEEKCLEIEGYIEELEVWESLERGNQSSDTESDENDDDCYV